MPDEDANNIDNTIKGFTELAKVVPVYQDAIQPFAKETGKALQTVGKTVNVALMPLRGLVWGSEKMEEFIKIIVSEKLKNRAPEEIISPNLSVAGPVYESLKYVGHEEALREMYANLLANAMDINTKEDAHPSFVEIIKQLTSEEAKLLLFLSQLEIYPEVCFYSENKTVGGGFLGFGESGITSNQVKNEFFNLCSKFEDDLNINAALDNYHRLQILDIESNTIQRIEDNWIGLYDNSDKVSEHLQLDIEHSEKLFFTSFGQKFIQICVANKV